MIMHELDSMEHILFFEGIHHGNDLGHVQAKDAPIAP